MSKKPGTNQSWKWIHRSSSLVETQGDETKHYRGTVLDLLYPITPTIDSAHQRGLPTTILYRISPLMPLDPLPIDFEYLVLGVLNIVKTSWRHPHSWQPATNKSGHASLPKNDTWLRLEGRLSSRDRSHGRWKEGGVHIHEDNDDGISSEIGSMGHVTREERISWRFNDVLVSHDPRFTCDANILGVFQDLLHWWIIYDAKSTIDRTE